MIAKYIRTITLFFLLSTLDMFAQDTWCEVATPTAYNGVSIFNDEANGWVASSRTSWPSTYLQIYRTKDSARTWTLDFEVLGGNSSRAKQIRAIDMVDTLNGWIGGGIVHGNDDMPWPMVRHRAWIPGTVGIQWHFQDTKLPQGNVVTAIKAFSPTHVVIATSKGIIAGSHDSGETWEIIGTVQPDFDVQKMHFTDINNGWVTSWDQLFATTDGGRNWRKVDFGKPFTITSIHFYNSTNGWLGGEGGKIRKTTNGGSTWFDHWSTTGVRIEDIKFVTQNVGFAVGGGIFDSNGWRDSSRVLKTHDGGTTWYQVKHPRDSWIGRIHMVGPTNGYITARQFVYSYCGDQPVSVQDDADGTAECEKVIYDLLGQSTTELISGPVIEYDPCKGRGRIVLR